MRATGFLCSNFIRSNRTYSTEEKAFLNMAKTLGMKASLESDETGAEIERERLIFGKIKNVADLEKAGGNPVQQEQYEIKIPKTEKNALGGKMRVRCSTPVGSEEKTYSFTIKTDLPIDDDTTTGIEKKVLEITKPSTEEVFLAFQYLAEGGMNKIRYEFPIEGTDLKWEYDIFTDAQGNIQPWCKIDLELPAEGLAEQPPFPIEMERIITSNVDQQTEEEKTILDTLFSTVFKFVNPHLR